LFVSLSLLFFYLFFEGVLIPMVLLIGIWGSRQRKIHAVYQFFFFTFAGSILMLITLLYLYYIAKTFDVRYLTLFDFSAHEERLLWFLLFVALAVKVPMFPFHV